ncbi:MAG: Ig-like domain-containing protein [Candidatus Cloacimonetes bacterium]|nr:Ig-like domain-containing protein [Candidatus Cloacimonadota bacterium]
MKNLFFIMLLGLIFFTACEEKITVNLQEKESRITGKVFPFDATVEFSGQIFSCDSEGFFAMNNLQPGTYHLKIKADSFGSKYLTVNLKSGENHYLGDIYLSELPYPIKSVELNRQSGSPDVILDIRTEENIDETILSQSVMSSDACFTVTGIIPKNNQFTVSFEELIYDCEYTFRIDSLALSFGREMDFPLIYSFQTDPFKIVSGDFVPGRKSCSVAFNGSVDISTLNLNSVTVNPPASLEILYYQYLDNYAGITSIIVSNYEHHLVRIISNLQPATTYTMTFDETICAGDGSHLDRLYEYSLNTPAFAISSTVPLNNQENVSIYSAIIIRFNGLVNPESIASYISIFPELNYYSDVQTTNTGNYPEQVEVYLRHSDNLMNGTTYTVTIAEEFEDFWGGDLGADYTFSFKTAD